ncbi:putative transporter (formate/nitrite transporter family protein) [Oceanicola granulosus HTCC2516]|uniref:Putative transporter (Formate/nitrite transporter family protein) n=1 Tax=Oceanicola granulosus (strain ATCC BAA-861 / DSM 15982 / KCTC 12143 / HTCC2516) TaxID=314256 RepID=Q2CIT4_OCEGH|nr:formate/nitrite transporter family protein [Oceanicola granulosus]EAR52505.1 putative transporter (formate/nitrite transporter family protein) [Oceanicola granulosus HTCC2516]
MSKRGAEERLRDISDEKLVKDAAKLRSKLVYEVIRRDGEEELERTQRSLFWAGIAAGVLISFSVIGEALLRTYLPQGQSWTYIVENLGYSFGFLLVILGRMQLFTENTITTVLPFMQAPTLRNLMRVLRLWAIVLGANVVGAFVAGWWLAQVGAMPEEVIPTIRGLSEHATGMGAWESFVRGVPAGILVAAIVWMMPLVTSGAEFLVIMVFTWLIALGDFTHVVAGSVEMAFLMIEGGLGAYEGVFDFFLPVFAGNVVGGTLIFAAMAWGQVKDEYHPETEQAH